MKIRNKILSGILAIAVIGTFAVTACNTIETPASGQFVLEPVPPGTESETQTYIGMSLTVAEILSENYVEYNVSAEALKAYTLTASYAPSYVAIETAVDWSVSFVDPSSKWATGKIATNYITVTPESDGALTATVECLEAFGSDILVTATLRANNQIKADCLCVWIHTDEDDGENSTSSGSSGSGNESGGSSGSGNESGGSSGSGNESGGNPDPEPECAHRDANDDGLCDKCGEEFSDGDETDPDPEPECEHSDEDDDGLCDKCGEEFSDGDETDPEPEPECEHRDEDDDGLCDKCGESFSDGDEPECEHRDENDNGLCDKCGESFSDGDEPECEHLDADYSGFCDKCGGDIAGYDSDEIVEENYKEFYTADGRYPIYNPNAPLITEGSLYDEVQLPDDGYIYFVLVRQDGLQPQPFVLRFFDNQIYFYIQKGSGSTWENWVTKDCKRAASDAGVIAKIDELGNIWYAAGHCGNLTDPFYVSVIGGKIYFAFSDGNNGWDFYTIEGVNTDSSKTRHTNIGNHVYYLVKTDECPILELTDYVESDAQNT